MTAHALPEVTKAVSEQAGRIIHSSTLYLNRPMVELAERVAQLSGIPDARVFFTTSGTEANDTALMLATTYRQSNTDPGDAQQLPRPLLQRGRHHRQPRLVARPPCPRCRPCTSTGASAPAARTPRSSDDDFIAACVDDLKDLLGHTRPPAALIAEPIQGVGGFTSPPDGLYAAFREVLAERGILWIADEVQTGWGRTGDHFWGWQAHAQNGPPDILTFAKGIGNGMSIGGVVARAEIMNCLDSNSISTFGGTQITMAAGLANLTYLLEHDLQGNARRVGGLLIERLRAVAAQVPDVREVRGRGLMLGIELVKPGTDEADPEAASAVLEAARADGLLIGKGGGHNTSALRIAPPLSLTVAEAEEGAAILERALRSTQ